MGNGSRTPELTFSFTTLEIVHVKYALKTSFQAKISFPGWQLFPIGFGPPFQKCSDLSLPIKKGMRK